MSAKMTKEEKSLLLYFETQVVDQSGWIKDTRHMNAEDFEIMKRWNESGFVLSRRASRDLAGQKQLTYVLKLSEKAWRMAHKLRKEKALRNIPDKLKDES